MAKAGTIVWHDLTVDDAPAVRDFYAAVVGWTPSPISMGDYDDYSMMAGEEGIAGVCHRRGPNAAIPPQWLLYVAIDDLDASIAVATQHGGKIILGPKNMGEKTRYCIVQDPAGAVMGLFEQKE